MNKISIIIPIYNADKYLKDCLDSIISQTYKNIEIIAVDDGSTDTSFDILQAYQKTDDRIKIIKQKNSGSAIARANGIKNAFKSNNISLVKQIINSNYVKLFCKNYKSKKFRTKVFILLLKMKIITLLKIAINFIK